MTPKEFCLEKIPSAFCCKAAWKGYHVWEHSPEKLLSYGKTPHLAWLDLKRKLQEKNDAAE
jgi:hypothetical protein